jgi:hypothetical protein
LIKIVSIFRGKKKGVMVPPVIVDVYNDGTDDILVSTMTPDGKCDEDARQIIVIPIC